MISSELALLGAVILLTLAFLLSLIDVAFHYLSKVSLRILGEESWKANYLRACLEDPMKLFLPLRIGIQGALIGVTVLLTDFFISSGVPQALLLAFLTMLPIFLIFREALPNIIARRNPERVLLVLLPAFRVYEPMVSFISKPLSRLVRAFTGEEGQQESVSEEEVQAYIETGEEEGILEGDEGKMVQSIVDLEDKLVREIMTPRPEIVGVSADATMAELCKLFSEEKYSRVPVYEGNVDHIRGLVYAIDLLAFTNASPDASIEPLIREVRFVPETKRVAELLREFQRRQSTFAIVVDEYGGTSGLITVEDILEEIVGEIHDEFDEVDEEIVREREGVFLVSGKADIDQVKERLHLEVNGKGFETVSGFLLDKLGRVPQVGEVIDCNGMKIEVVDAEGQRINRVRFRL